jgi:2-polyprenyl-6-hydroxyphenyl methylase/3-demethylubiquinone-9 3-methyltransferase
MKRNDLEFYSNVASEWWQPDSLIYALNHLNPLRFDYFDRHLADWQGVRVLDIGCGGGYTCEFLAARGAIVSGLDQSQDCITVAQDHANQQGFSIDYQQGLAESLSYADASFDAIVCVDVLEHVSNLTQVIQEIERVLKPEGCFLFDTINRTWQSKLIMIWLLENILKLIPTGIHDWNQFVTPEELTSLLIQSGFDQIEIKGFSLFGNSLADYFAAYTYYRQTGKLRSQINQDVSVMYIGKAIKRSNDRMPN